jgi:Flp pilus assembly protein TadB
MDWLQVLVIIFGNAAWVLPVFFWVRSEARADARKSDQDNKELRRDLVEVMRSIDKEMKDFHGRLCDIEARRK